MQTEKLTAFDRARTTVFFSGINNFIKFGPEINTEFEKRKESFDFVENFLFDEDFNNHNWKDVNHHLKSLVDFHEILLHHQSWEGARELDPRLWEIIGITKRIYVLLRKMQTTY